MGRRGPPPKPTRLKIASGLTGKKAGSRREPQPALTAPRMPSWLSAKAKAEWKRITPELVKLGLLSRIDMAALAAYCTAVAELELATEMIDKEGRVTSVPILAKGEKVGEQLRAHPAVKQQRDAL